MNSRKTKRELSVDADGATLEKYTRGPMKINTKKIKYKGLRLTLEQEQEKTIRAAELTAATEVLLPFEPVSIVENQNESSSFTSFHKLKQSEIVKYVDLNTTKNKFDLQLHDFGPYCIDYTRNGRHMLFGGRKGHVAVMDCLTMNVGAELQLEEEVHDVKFLQNESMFAVAQKEYTYIYDSHGTEIHCVRNLSKPYRLDFLPYHYLLVCIGQHGWIRWHDISTGLQVGGYATGLGSCNVMKHNRQNSITHLGHRNGIVTLWSPASGKALVSLFCHKTPIADLGIDRDGRYLASTGYDGLLKIWDLRTYRTLHTYHLDAPATSIDISDSGLLSVAMGRNIQILRDPYTKPANLTYLRHEIRTPNVNLSSGGGVVAATKALKSSVSILRLRFRPLEDVLCAGHSHGISTIIVPGAGEANFDAFEANPFRTLKQRREEEIQSLLNKLSPDMIVLDAKSIGTVDKDLKTLQEEHRELFQTANMKPGEKKKEKNRMRGKNKISSKLRRKQKNVVDEQTLKLKSMLEEERSKENEATKQSSSEEKGLKRSIHPSTVSNTKLDDQYDPLSRFERKK